MNTITASAIVAVSVLAAGCSSLGPDLVADNHTGYSKAVQTARSDAALLNIVRLRYQDSPVDLRIDSITTQFSVDIGSGSEFGTVEGSTSANITPYLRYSERPTIVFVPQRGDDYFATLTTPLRFYTIVNLIDADGDIETVFRLAIREINGVRNNLNAASPEFLSLVSLMKLMAEDRDLVFGYELKDQPLSDLIGADRLTARDLLAAAEAGYRYKMMSQDRYQLVQRKRVPGLWINANCDHAGRLRGALKLESQQSGFYPLTDGAAFRYGDETRNTISIRTRSLLEIGAYLSNGVAVPVGRVDLTNEIASQGLDLRGFFYLSLSDTPQEVDVPVFSLGLN